MNNRDLIAELEKANPEAEAIVFVAGKLYPVLCVQSIDDTQIEIGCGWAEMVEDAD